MSHLSPAPVLAAGAVTAVVAIALLLLVAAVLFPAFRARNRRLGQRARFVGSGGPHGNDGGPGPMGHGTDDDRGGSDRGGGDGGGWGGDVGGGGDGGGGGGGS